MDCSNCRMNYDDLTVFVKIEKGIEEMVLTPDDIVLKGSVGTGWAIVDDKSYLFPKLPVKFFNAWKKLLCVETDTKYPQLPVADFHGLATLTFDGYLDNEDMKLASEERLHAYRFTGEIHLVGCEHPWRSILEYIYPLQRLYYLAADFDLLPRMMSTYVQVRISPERGPTLS